VVLHSDFCTTVTQVRNGLPAQLLELLEELRGPLFDLRPLGGRRALGSLPELGGLLLDRLDLPSLRCGVRLTETRELGLDLGILGMEPRLYLLELNQALARGDLGLCHRLLGLLSCPGPDLGLRHPLTFELDHRAIRESLELLPRELVRPEDLRPRRFAGLSRPGTGAIHNESQRQDEDR
jgi:hypothetical protein